MKNDSVAPRRLDWHVMTRPNGSRGPTSGRAEDEDSHVMTLAKPRTPSLPGTS
ncbi:MAG TPA: hypothetical protein VEL31_24235 [Ktedonobacteraceae bacterium]|nr:hypothetical protein [Ktedonobacteraceae bacterium]